MTKQNKLKGYMQNDEYIWCLKAMGTYYISERHILTRYDTSKYHVILCNTLTEKYLQHIMYKWRNTCYIIIL